jgi:hypothetical protein
MKNFKPEMLGNPDLSQRVLDLQAGISSAPASMVNNEKKHLLGLFDAIDELAGQVTALKAENEKLAAANADTEVVGG